MKNRTYLILAVLFLVAFVTTFNYGGCGGGKGGGGGTDSGSSAILAPSGLVATTLSWSRIDINWINNATNANGVKIERKTGAGGTWTQIDTVGSSTSSYANLGLTNGTTYYFRVRAYNSSGNSDYSNEANATTTLLPPSGSPTLSASTYSSSRIDLSWTDPSSNEDGFQILRHTEDVFIGNFTEIATVGPNVTAYTDTAVTRGVLYYYYVRPYNSAGNGNASNGSQATALKFTTTIIDNTEAQYTSLAVDSNNKVHISYYDVTNTDLKYATDASGSWVTTIIDSNGGTWTSLALDSNNKAHISYFLSSSLKYATNATGSWVTTVVDGSVSGESGFISTSIAVTGTATIQVHISYQDAYRGSEPQNDLKYATNASGSWVIETAAGTGPSNNIGDLSSLALDSNNKAHITCRAGANTLKYVTNQSGSWVESTIGSIGNHQYARAPIACDSNNKLHTIYDDSFGLKYANNVPGSWVTSAIYEWGGSSCSITIDSNNKVHASFSVGNYIRYASNESGAWVTSSLGITGSGEFCSYTSIALDSNNRFHISYGFGSTALKYATDK